MDGAIYANNLLETISISSHLAAGVSGVIERRGDGKSVLLKGDVEELKLFRDVLGHQQELGRQQVQKISEQSYLLAAYDKKAKADRFKDEQTPTRSKDPYFIRKIREFKRTFNNKKKTPTKEAPPLPATNMKEASRRSERQVSTVSPEKTAADTKKEYNGQPPFPIAKWTKPLLIEAIQKLEEGGEHYKVISKRQFMTNVVKSGKSSYTSRQGISFMYNTWLRSDNGKVPGGVGRPSSIDIDAAESIVKNVIQERSSDSNRIKLEHVTDALNKEKLVQAAKDGLDPKSTNVKTSQRRVKEAMTSVAMRGDESDIGMSKKKVAKKTEARYRGEHSIMGAYAYATTVLATHFVAGPRPHTKTFRKYSHSKLSDNAKQTVEWVKQAYGVEDVHPVDPNLVLSTDDTTLFVFEGTQSDGCKDAWEWKLVDKTEAGSSVHSDFQVSQNAEMGGGLRVRLTFTFTASGMAAPPYVAVSGLTADELSPSLCEDGLLAAKIPGLCKGGNDLFNEGYGWLVFLRADRKNNKDDQEKAALSIANKKFIHYNDEVLLPFIRSIRKQLGWIFDPESDVPVPEYLRAVSWFDGDIGQLQTMIDEARQALDEAENIIRNKHSAATTGRQQPCDLSPVFRLLKQFQLNNSAVDSTACGLAETLDEYFTSYLRLKGLNLDGNPRKKKALIDFLLCLPDMLEQCMKPKHIKKGFVVAGMIDETGFVPVFEDLMGTCIRWGSADKNVGLPLDRKTHCRNQLQALLRLQLDKSQISYEDMAERDIPWDIGSNGKELQSARPSGPNGEHRQSAKTINGRWQIEQRRNQRMKNLSAQYAKAVADRDVINLILQRNIEVEQELLRMRNDINTLEDVTISDLLALKGKRTEKIKAFIHARKFETRDFETSRLVGASGKLNLLLFKKQTASSIESNCSEEAPCLVWWAWKCRSDHIILSATEVAAVDDAVVMPQFTVTSAGPSEKKRPSDYLSDPNWLQSLGAAVKGVKIGTVSDQMKTKADYLCSVMDGRLNSFIASTRVDESRKDHWTLKLFTRENLPAMAAALCIFGHIVDDDITTYGMEECLLASPIFDEDAFCDIDDDEDLAALQGCYMYYNIKRMQWIRSGKTSGDGEKASFRGRGDTHKKNSRSVDEMKEHQFYALYPSKKAKDTIGRRKGYFEDLLMYCGMAFDPTEDVTALCSNGESDSLFVWNDQVMKELKAKGGEVRKYQLDAVAYLWELCYDLLLDKSHNVSVSPGFESLGLRVNMARKRKASD